MKREQRLKEEWKMQREELKRRYCKFIVDSIFDENKANSDYIRASQMAETLGLPDQAGVLSKIAEEEARHSRDLQWMASHFKLQLRKR